MTVGEICSRIVHTADFDETVAVAAKRMREANVGSMPVLDENARLVGLVTDRDLVLRVLAERRNAEKTRVAEVMSECVETVRENASIETALAAMRHRTTRRLPVVDANDAFVGILSIDDVLELLAEDLGTVGRVIGAESPAKLTTEALSPRPRETSAAPQAHTATAAAPAIGLAEIERSLREIRESIELIACALSTGLRRRLLGGQVSEADIRAVAERRLRGVLARAAPEAEFAAGS